MTTNGNLKWVKDNHSNKPICIEKALLSLQQSSIHVKLKKDVISEPISEPFSPVSWLEHHFANKLYSFSQTKMAFRYLVKDPDGHSHLFVSAVCLLC